MKPSTSKIAVKTTSSTVCSDVHPAKLKRLAADVCRKFDIPSAAIHVSIVDDDGIKALHKQFFNSSRTTDVISFDLSDEQEPRRHFDIIINIDEARRQACKRGHAVQAEIALYLVHGILHQLGFDDLSDAKARRMHRMEDEILRDAGYGAVYNSDKQG